MKPHPAPLVYPTYQHCALCFEVTDGKTQEKKATYVFVKRAELALSGARFSAWLSPTGCLRARTCGGPRAQDARLRGGPRGEEDILPEAPPGRLRGGARVLARLG